MSIDNSGYISDYSNDEGKVTKATIASWQEKGKELRRVVRL